MSQMIKEQQMHYTPTQQRLLQVLSDGQRHTLSELFECIEDELADVRVVNKHLWIIRKKLRPIGQDVLCESTGRLYFYRHVRLLADPSLD